MIAFYYFTTILPIALSGIFIMKYGKKASLYFSIIFLLISIINVGYFAQALSNSLESALFANGIAYLDGCYLEFFYLLYLASFCKVELNRYIKALLFSISTVIFVISITASKHHLLYRSVTLTKIHGVSVLEKEYGPFHTVYYALIGVYLILNLGLLIYGSRKKEISRKNFRLLVVMYFLTFFSFLIGKKLIPGLDLLPLTQALSLIIFLIIAKHLSYYNLNDMVVNTLENEGLIGIVLFDEKKNYLGCNKTALTCFPELKEQYVDYPLNPNSNVCTRMNDWMNQTEKKQGNESFIWEKGDITYKITVGYMYQKKRTIGYQLRIEDDTREQAYVKLLNDYNTNLQKEVAAKTEHIQNILNRFVIGMAEMVQNRDNNTGGHIMRTSRVVELLADEILKDNKLNLSDEFFEALIKAAPMHDLGKIAVDDAILRKPGKFTDEEYAIMKSHSEKGAQIVHSLLADVENPYFVNIAVNVAHYHHERYDGTGYPVGLSGEDIPIEARIMAIADVYDALVSKRCYKEAFSFEKASQIIQEGMGTQFDPILNSYFCSAREKIEAYYSSNA